MYKYNPTPPYMTDEQKEKYFSLDSLKKMQKNIEEKKENEAMRNQMDLLIDTLIQKQTSILNKVQMIDEKGAAYKLSEQGDVIQNLLASLDEVENQLDDSLESFDKVDDSIGRAWERIKSEVEETWSKFQEGYEELAEDDKEHTKTFHATLDIIKHEQSVDQFYSPEYKMSYVMTDENRVRRVGKKIINPNKYESGVLTDFAVKLIEEYEDGLLAGDIVSYSGHFPA